MSRIIIDNQSSRSDKYAMELVAYVMKDGKISNDGKQHCYHTTFFSRVSVSTFLNKTSERFVVMDIKEGT